MLMLINYSVKELLVASWKNKIPLKKLESYLSTSYECFLEYLSIDCCLLVVSIYAPRQSNAYYLIYTAGSEVYNPP